jgi:hypothetical protein
MTFSLAARQIHDHIVEIGASADWLRAAHAATKRGRMGGWFGVPKHKYDSQALMNKLKEQLGWQFPDATESDWREVAEWLFRAVPP